VLKSCRKRKCRACKEWYQPARALQNVCSYPCAIEKSKADKIRLERKQILKRKYELKPITQLVREAQAVVNKFIRLRDKKLGCISCGAPVDEAGHYFHAGTKYRVSRLRLDPRNINGQCTHCNRFKGGGNLHEYRKGFVIRYGEKAMKKLEDLKRQADQDELKPLSRDELVEFKRSYSKQIRQMAQEV